MTAQPAITVAMSMHNAAPYLRECIDSILSQTFIDYELLIVDDGSTDDSVDIVRSYCDPRIRLICRPHDFTASLNTLLDEARGRYIARMDADDVMLPERLRKEHDYLEAHPEVAAVCSHATRTDASGAPTGHIGHGQEVERITPRMMCGDNCVCNPTTMMRREVVAKAGVRYEKEYEYAEDYRFWSRVVTECGPIDCLPATLLLYRTSDTQVTATHWDEMMEATARIKADLTLHLVAEANPGYTDPVIAPSNRQLSLIIPFLNEGDEVENTIRSFRQYGGDRMDIIVINDCSHDSYPYMERLRSIPGVYYFLNRERLGVAGSRDKGVALCRTPYFLLLDAHMRAYDDSWLTTIPALLRENDRRILCCQTRFLVRDIDGNIAEDSDSPPAFGARMTFKPDELMPGIEWIKEERIQGVAYEAIPCVLGAGYGMSRRYWSKIGGLTGLRRYGCDEQLLSVKTWLEGGSCLLLKDVRLGHIYRKTMPYAIPSWTMTFNHLFVTESTFPIKEACKARAAACRSNRADFWKIFKEVRNYLALHPDIRRANEANLNLPFRELVTMNRTATSIEHRLLSDIEVKIHEIAGCLMSGKCDVAGLYEGNLGRSLWLFHYSAYTGNPEAADSARRFLDKAVQDIDFGNTTFSDGIAGLGWTLVYLSQKGFYTHSTDLLAKIDASLTRYLNTYKPSSDLSLSSGFGGILAYCCVRSQIFAAPDAVGAALNSVAQTIFANRSAATTELFYAFLWMTVSESAHLDEISLSLTDWFRPSGFVPKDARFWKMSLFDGVMASSALCFNIN